MSVILVSCGKSNSSKSVPLTIGYSALTADYLPLYVARDFGMFKSAGLMVGLELTKTGSVTVTAVSSNSIQMGSAAGDAFVHAWLAGARSFRIVSGLVGVNDMTLYTTPKFAANPSEIKTVAVAKGSASDAAFEMMKERGLLNQLSRGVSMDEVGAAKVAAIKSGQVDAGPFSIVPGLEAKRSGLVKAIDLTPMGISYPMAVLGVNKDFLSQHPVEVSKVVAALNRATTFIKENPSVVKEEIAKLFNLSAEESGTVYRFYQNLFNLGVSYGEFEPIIGNPVSRLAGMIELGLATAGEG